MRQPLKLWQAIALMIVLSTPLAWGANTMWSALSALTGVNTATGDKFPLLDVSDTTDGAGGTAKTITRDELKLALSVPRAFVISGSHYTNTSTTGSEITGIGPMTVSVAGSYFIDCKLLVQSVATSTSWKFGVNYTGTASPMVANAYFPSAGVTAATGTMHDANNATTGQVWSYANTRTESTTAPNLGPWIGTTNANVDHLMHLDAFIVASDTGDIEVWAGSEVAASGMQVSIGSFCLLYKL